MIQPPRPARWFHLIAHPDDLPAAVAILAEDRAVQLERESTELVLNRELGALLESFRQLEERYSTYWPAPGPVVDDDHHSVSVLESMSRSLATLEAWRVSVEPFLNKMQQAQAESWDLLLLEDLASHLIGEVLDFSLWREEEGGAGEMRSALFVLPLVGSPPPVPDSLLVIRVDGDSHLFLLVAGEVNALLAYRELILLAKGRYLPIPQWMRCRPDKALQKIQNRRLRREKILAGLQIDIARLRDVHQLSTTLAVVYRLRWYYQQVQPVTGPHLAQITGWTVAHGAEPLNRRLQECGIRALVGMPDAPALSPPMILENPWWAKPFELFPAMLGVPGRHEVDPTRLLAILMPLLFGFMFGDVGQGPVLALAGYLIARRLGMELGWLLFAGGLAATVFGFLFGSLFCLEGIVPALWLHPLSHPMTLLAVPLGLGTLIVTGGTLLEGVQAHWRGEFHHWRCHGLGVLAVYWGVLTLFFSPWGLLPIAVGVAAVVAGGARQQGVVGALIGLAHLPETLMQMGVNTLSFSRVGAFALAHAGLSQAVVSLADLAGNPVGWLLVLVLGNAIILLLEGLVVSVQTTRLVLFEFFIRFLKGEGRAFVPTPPVAVSS